MADRPLSPADMQVIERVLEMHDGQVAGISPVHLALLLHRDFGIDAGSLTESTDGGTPAMWLRTILRTAPDDVKAAVLERLLQQVAGATEESWRRAYEGIVLRLRQHQPETADMRAQRDDDRESVVFATADVVLMTASLANAVTYLATAITEMARGQNAAAALAAQRAVEKVDDIQAIFLSKFGEDVLNGNR